MYIVISFHNGIDEIILENISPYTWKVISQNTVYSIINSNNRVDIKERAERYREIMNIKTFLKLEQFEEYKNGLR